MRTSTYPTFLLAAAASLLSLAGPARAQPASGGRGLTEEQARRILPRADLSGLTDEQRSQFLEVSGDVFDYAGCKDTLAKCLGANVQDVHALRMAGLVKALILEGGSTSRVIEMVENYYASFDASKRVQVKTNDCPVLGDPKAPVAIVEFSDYQCPHCAVANKPLHELVTGPEKGKARLCSKYFPLPGHSRARIAAACAEFAKRQDKFWQMNDLLFANQDQLDDESLKRYAKQVGLDGRLMLQEVYAGKFDSAIDAHLQEGNAARVNSTPTLFINGRQHLLPAKLEFLQRSVEDELEWQQNKSFTYASGDGRAQKG
ncbi:MAG TPA: thioredoxin domain-containing protein [Myxococcales bacterium]|nr:thioredoxin domain-containing protein [Myxococcales bacterium]